MKWWKVTGPSENGETVIHYALARTAAEAIKSVAGPSYNKRLWRAEVDR